MKYKIDNGGLVLMIIDEHQYQAQVTTIDRDISEVLHDAYILREPIGIALKNFTEFKDYDLPEPIATTLDIDWYSLKGQVYDQYGKDMEIPITFTIEGTDKAKIADGKIVTEDVKEDTSFFIVAKANNLEKREERWIYAPHKEEDPMMILTKKVNALTQNDEMRDDLLQELILKVYEKTN